MDDTDPAHGEIEAFLSAQFAVTPAGHANYIWVSAGSRETKWFSIKPSSLGPAVSFAMAQRNRADLYWGCTPTAGPLGPRERGKLQDRSALTALWCDLDWVSDVGHLKEGIFADQPEAEAFMAEVWPEPTMVVHSGRGIHGWWLLEGAKGFKDEDDRLQAAALSEAWGQMGLDAAAEIGRSVDSVWDLPRVLRIPGTVNHKDPENPLPVRLLTHGGPTYTRKGMIELVGKDAVARHRETVGTKQQVAKRIAKVAATVKREMRETAKAMKAEAAGSDAMATMPPRWDLLVHNDPTIMEYFDRNPAAWASPSEQQLAFANKLATSGFSEGEMTSILMRQRAMWGVDDKHAGYYSATVGKACSWAESQGTRRAGGGTLTMVPKAPPAQPAIPAAPVITATPVNEEPVPEASVPLVGPADVAPPPAPPVDQEPPQAHQYPETAASQPSAAQRAPAPQARSGEQEGKLEDLSKFFGAPIIRVEKHEGLQSSLAIVFEDGREAHLGTLQNAYTQRNVDGAITQATDHTMEMMSTPSWRAHVQWLWELSEPVDLGGSMTHADLTRDAVDLYLSQHAKPPSPGEPDYDGAAIVQLDTGLAVALDLLTAWAKRDATASHVWQKFSQYERVRGMKELGATLYHEPRITRDQRTSMRALWILPRDWDGRTQKFRVVREDQERAQ